MTRLRRILINISQPEQESLDTAIDQGGPLRQFKTDVWKQLNTLSIPVWDTTTTERKRVMIRIFEEASNSEGNCVVPITNATLESRIKNVAHGDTESIQDALQHAKDYTRAIGRIMLHSFLNGHTVSTSAMAPIFMNDEPKCEFLANFVCLYSLIRSLLFSLTSTPSRMLPW